MLHEENLDLMLELLSTAITGLENMELECFEETLTGEERDTVDDITDELIELRNMIKERKKLNRLKKEL